MAGKEEDVDVEEEDELEEEEESTLANSDVVTKYKTASDIANQVMNQLLKEIAPGKQIVDLCVLGDKLMTDAIDVIYTKGNIEKGIAFPTSISVNNCAGHFSPLVGENATLTDGDLVKIDLGVHIDGYIYVAAHSTIVQGSATTASPQPISGRKADVILAAHYAAECAHRLIKPGKKNTDVTDAIKKVAEQFKCESLEGVLSHEMKRFVIDGNHVIINKSTLEQKVETFEFEENQVYGVDIVMSTGEGKARETETRTTIYKRAVDQNYLLKMQAARYVFNEINKRFPTLPFSLRALDEKRGKLGITECLKHGIVSPYPVLYEKPGEFVAQFKFTVLILPSGTLRLNTFPLLSNLQSEHKITDPSVDEILKMSTKRAKKNKNKKKKKKAPKEESKSATEDEKKEGDKPAEPKPMDTGK